IAPKTLGESMRGKHIHSTLPLLATSAVTSQSERKAYSAMGGNGEMPGLCSNPASISSGRAVMLGSHGSARPLVTATSHLTCLYRTRRRCLLYSCSGSHNE